MRVFRDDELGLGDAQQGVIFETKTSGFPPLGSAAFAIGLVLDIDAISTAGDDFVFFGFFHGVVLSFFK